MTNVVLATSWINFFFLMYFLLFIIWNIFYRFVLALVYQQCHGYGFDSQGMYELIEIYNLNTM